MSQERNNQMLAYSGVDKLHALGYKGNGIKVMVLDTLSSPEKHGEGVIKANRVAGINVPFVLEQSSPQAWRKAIDEKFDIVHISMTGFDKALSEEFVSKGGIVTCSTGNYDTSEFSWWEHVIDVGAIWENLQVPNYSARSETVDMVCFVPYVQREDGSWFQQIGTSFTFIAGLVACLLEHWKHIGYKYTPQSVKEYLIKHAVDILAAGKDNQSGYGYVKVGLMNTIKAQIDKNELVINGVVKPIGLKANGTQLPGARLVEGSTMVPMRAIGDAIESIIKDKTVLSYKTDWDSTTKTAIYFIDTK